MMYKLLDKVLFISDSQKGVVSKILDKNKYLIYVEEYGMDIPATENELVPDVDYNTKGKGDEIAVNAPIQKEDTSYPPNLYIYSYVEDQSLKIGLYLNRPKEKCQFVAFQLLNGEYNFTSQGILENEKRNQLLGSFALEDQSNYIHFAIECIFYTDGSKNPPKYMSVKKKWKTSQLLSTSILLPIKEKKSGFFEAILDSEESTIKEKKSVNNKYKVPDIIDLHIEKLFPQNTHQYQINALKFQKLTILNTIENCLLSGKPKITVIHGIGNGVLKRLVWDIATEHPHVFSIQEAHYQSFGYGASEIIFKQ